MYRGGLRACTTHAPRLCAALCGLGGVVGQLVSSYGLWGYAIQRQGHAHTLAWFPITLAVAGGALVGWGGILVLCKLGKVRCCPSHPCAVGHR